MLDIKEMVNKEDQERQDQLLVVKGYMQRCIEKDVLQTLEVLQGSAAGALGGNALLRSELELRLEARQRQAALPALGLVIPRDYCSMRQIMIRMEVETLKFTDFVNSTADQPLLESTMKRQESYNFKRYRSLIHSLEHHVESLIILDHYEDAPIESIPQDKDLAAAAIVGPDL